MKIISWNVNGLRSLIDFGLFDALERFDADIVCLQETKSTSKQVDLSRISHYHAYWNSARRKGYAGVLVLSKVEPIAVREGFGVEKFDIEGRVLTLEFAEFYLLNLYMPVSSNSLKRKEYRKEWDECLLNYIKENCLDKPMILCGDFNVAHTSYDIYPENYSHIADSVGFETIERENFDGLLQLGLVDIFRYKYPETMRYTWWSNRMNKRKEDRGWRLDYFLVSTSLISQVVDTVLHNEILGSDHCPISLSIDTKIPFQNSKKDEELADFWDMTDWLNLENELFALQSSLCKAVEQRNQYLIETMQKRILNSLSAKMLAVKHICSSNSETGVDGVRWNTSAKKMLAACNLNKKDYVSLPFRCVKIYESSTKKTRHINIPTYFDRAMQTLYSYALSPIAETLADDMSFGFRKGRSTLDACHYLVKELSDSEYPLYVVKCDVKSYYDTISHQWILEHIPMDKNILTQFIKAGYTLNGELFEIEQGISLGGVISPIIGNMVLDGLQDAIDTVIATSKKNRRKGKSIRLIEDKATMIRFADDFVVVTNNKSNADGIKHCIELFLEERGLRLSEEKSAIVKATDGFDFLGYRFQQFGYIVKVQPSEKAIQHFELLLETRITQHKGSIDSLIKKLNQALYGFASYHKTNDCEKAFRHLDVVVQALLAKKIRTLHPLTAWEKLRKKYWYHGGKGKHYFSHPDKKELRVIFLSDVFIRKHVPVKIKYNYFIDSQYYKSLEKHRKIQKVTGDRYKGVWHNQDGRCYFCGKLMLPDHTVDLIQLVNEKSNVYIHANCKNSTQIYRDVEESCEGVEIASLLESVLSYQHELEDPYYGLRQFFLKESRQLFTLTFKEIETLVVEDLPWEAYLSKRYWYDIGFGYLEEDHHEEFPDHAIIFPEESTKIAGAWIENGYRIQKINLERKKISFRKENHAITNLNIPSRLLESKISKEAATELEDFFKYIIKKYNL